MAGSFLHAGQSLLLKGAAWERQWPACAMSVAVCEPNRNHGSVCLHILVREKDAPSMGQCDVLLPVAQHLGEIRSAPPELNPDKQAVVVFLFHRRPLRKSHSATAIVAWLSR